MAILLSIAALSSGCKKDDSALEPGVGGKTPSEAVGKWMYGSFSMSDFWSYNGQYQGKPFELAVVFDFKTNGTYEKYFIASTKDYIGCKTEAFSYEKGRVSFDEAEGTFTTTPVEGNYRGFYSCLSGKNVNRKMNADELKPLTYYYSMSTGSTGKPNLIVRFNKGDSNTSTFFQTSW